MSESQVIYCSGCKDSGEPEEEWNEVDREEDTCEDCQYAIDCIDEQNSNYNHMVGQSLGLYR